MTDAAARSSRRDRLERRRAPAGPHRPAAQRLRPPQARQLADELADEELEAIYSSDLARARETAEIVGDRLGLPVVLDPDLREKDWGTWEGLTAVERDRVEFVGESTEAHQERILRVLRRISARHPGAGRVLVVTHGGSMRRVQAEALGMALPVVENCGRWLCACENGSFRALD